MEILLFVLIAIVVLIIGFAAGYFFALKRLAAILAKLPINALKTLGAHVAERRNK